MKKITIVLLVAVIIFSCKSKGHDETPKETNNKPDSVMNQTPRYDTISSMGDLQKEGVTAIFAAPNGGFYRLTTKKQELEEESTSSISSTESVNVPVTNPPCQGELFDGIDRKSAKLSIDPAPVSTYETLTDFRNTLPTDLAMGKNHNPAISTDEKSKRVIEEKRNVHIKTAWLYVFKREGDEDYHVIIGSTPNKNTARFFNIEVAGLPAAGNSSRAALKKVRTDFEEFFGIESRCISNYDKEFLDDPIKISVTGSLFFDKLHYTGHTSIGPGEASSDSYWEIHPITSIEFLR